MIDALIERFPRRASDMTKLVSIATGKRDAFEKRSRLASHWCGRGSPLVTDKRYAFEKRGSTELPHLSHSDIAEIINIMTDLCEDDVARWIIRNYYGPTRLVFRDDLPVKEELWVRRRVGLGAKIPELQVIAIGSLRETPPVPYPFIAVEVLRGSLRYFCRTESDVVHGKLAHHDTLMEAS